MDNDGKRDSFEMSSNPGQNANDQPVTNGQNRTQPLPPIMDKPLLSNGYRAPSYSTNVSVTKDMSKNKNIFDLTESKQLELPSLTVDALMQHRQIEHPTTNFETMIHLLKANIGTGVLALPQSFNYSGLAFGSVGLVVIAAICIHCMHMLLTCSQKLCIKLGLPPLDYASTVEQAFLTGPRGCRRFAKLARFFTNLFICVTQFGFCVVYWVFVARNIQTIVNNFTVTINWDYRIYMAIILVPFMVMVFIRNLKFLAPVSIIANICEAVAFVMIFYYLFQDLPPVSSRPQLPALSSLPLWFGTAVYAFEGIALVLPLENNMKTPRDMRGLTGVLSVSMFLVMILYIAVGFFGFLRFGSDLKGSITLSLPHQVPALVIQCAYTFAIFLSLAIQFYVPVGIIWPYLRRKVPKWKLAAEYVFRMVLIACIFALGAIIPQFELFISLVGALGGSCLSLIFPAILHMVTNWNDKFSWLSVTKDASIILLGLLGFLVGTYTSILSIVTAFRAES